MGAEGRLRRLGLKKSSQAVLWKLKTAAFKRWITAQDRFSWYGYPKWIEENETEISLPPADDSGFIISFLIPVSHDSRSALSPTLDSLTEQTHPQWEAYLIHEQGCAAEVLDRSAVDPARLHPLLVGEGGRQAGGLREAIAGAQGSWVGWLEPGDRLSPGTLTAVSETIAHHPRVEIIYTDEDRLEQDGKTRRGPFFKPDWSPDLLLSTNYLEHAFFRRELFDACAAEGDNFEDIVYRCAEQARSVVHIPRVLFHLKPNGIRRETARLQHIESPSAETLSRHLKRLRLPEARVQVGNDGQNRLTWTFPEQLISIIIPTRDRVDHLQRCLDSLLSLTRYRNFEVILVENNSQQAETLAYYDRLKAKPQVRIVEDHREFNYSAANNLGARQGNGNWLLFLNNDVEIIEPDWLEEIARWISRPEIGVVGARLLYPDGLIQHAGIVIGLEGHASHVFASEAESCRGPFGSCEWYRNYSAVTGACLATRREVFDAAGGFDEDYKLVFSDVEYCQSVIRQGYRVVYTPFARLIHREGRTRQRYIPITDIQRGAGHFKQVVKQGDPYYNPNLSYAIRKPTLKRKSEEAPIDRLNKIVEYA